MDPYVARQPIFDHKRGVYGYELLFRSGPENCYDASVDGDTATSSLMSDTVGVHGLEELTAGKKVFVNVTEKIIVSGLYTLFPPGQTVIELLETVEMTDEVCEACREVRRRGYLLALDDYVGDACFDCILDEIDILKVDFAETDPDQRKKLAQCLEGKQFTLLAEKVETQEEFQEAVDLGYSYMQGYFFCKPEMFKGAALPSFKLNCLQFLQQINQPDIDLDELEQIILRDVSLSYRLLKLLNSAALGVRNKVNSVKHAMVLLGDVQLRKWASLIALTNLGADKPTELLITSLFRGRFCESLGRAAGMTGCELNLFLLGMFSVLDAMIDRPMDEAMDQLPLGADILDTLAGRPTPLTDVYELVLSFEMGKWDRIGCIGHDLAIEDQEVARLYQDAILWAQRVLGSQQADAMRKAS